MADREDEENRPQAWLQTNTEFHQDWTADDNVGQHIEWKQGVTLKEPGTPDEAWTPKVQSARRRRPWRWVMLLGLFAAAAYGAVRFLGLTVG